MLLNGGGKELQIDVEGQRRVGERIDGISSGGKSTSVFFDKPINSGFNIVRLEEDFVVDS
jgi:hypothetical protein